MNQTEIDDLTCDIEDLRYNPEKASEVANNFKIGIYKIVKDLLFICEDNEVMKQAIKEYFEVEE